MTETDKLVPFMVPGTITTPNIPTNPLEIVEANDAAIFLTGHRVASSDESDIGGLFDIGRDVFWRIKEVSVEDD